MLHPFQHLPIVLSKSLTKSPLSSFTKEQMQCEGTSRVVSAGSGLSGAPAAGPFPPLGICLRGSCSFRTRPRLSCDLDPDKVSVVSSGVGNSSASPEKWVCPRFQFIIRSRRVQRRPIGRGRPVPRRAREGGQAAPWLPRSLCPCALGADPGCP